MISKPDTTDLMEELNKLAKLRADGAINDEEYKAVKAALIARISANFDERADKPSHEITISEESSEDALIRRIADYERISGILWIGIAIVQLITVYGAIAGIWNIVAGVSRIMTVKRIKARDSSIPTEFESVAQLIIIGIINLVLGGVIGVVFVAFDFFIRDKILSNRHLFDKAPDKPAQVTLGEQLHKNRATEERAAPAR
jgi:hypothetical protein